MEIYDTGYTHSEAEIEELRAFLVKSYAVSLKPFNWRLALTENWIFASRTLEPLEYFTSRVHQWRNNSGQLVAFVILGTDFSNIQIDYEYRSLEPEIYDWIERHPFGNNKQISAMVYDWDTERQTLLTKRGYQNFGPIEDVRIYDLKQTYPPVTLPPGYRITSMAEYADYAERIELENRVWNVSLDEKWFQGKSSAPSYSFEWDLLAVSPEGKLAAFNLVWRYPQNRTAELDPVGTHPDHRKRGLSRALILESFRLLRESGFCYTYIASETTNPVVSHLYSSLQPVETYQGFHWTKQLA
jgi:ribosomal protein S18 acetylase RimI-like enzyme